MARPEEEWVRVEGMHEAVVTKEEFRKVQGMVVFFFLEVGDCFAPLYQHFQRGVCTRPTFKVL